MLVESLSDAGAESVIRGRLLSGGRAGRQNKM